MFFWYFLVRSTRARSPACHLIDSGLAGLLTRSSFPRLYMPVKWRLTVAHSEGERKRERWAGSQRSCCTCVGMCMRGRAYGTGHGGRFVFFRQVLISLSLSTNLLGPRELVAERGAFDRRGPLHHQPRLPLRLTGEVQGRVARAKVHHRHFLLPVEDQGGGRAAAAAEAAAGPNLCAWRRVESSE